MKLRQRNILQLAFVLTCPDHSGWKIVQLQHLDRLIALPKFKLIKLLNSIAHNLLSLKSFEVEHSVSRIPLNN